MKISVVIPALNEAGNIGRLVEETLAAVSPDHLGEIIVIDDASTDETANEVLAVTSDIDIRCIRHEVRSGQSSGLRTGILAARFPIIATMDGDGQNDPIDIPGLYSKIGTPGSEGAVALVGGVRENRKDTGSKRWASKAANKIRDAVLRDDCPDTGCGIKLFWREGFLRLPFFTTMHRYLPALFQTYGYKCAYVPVNHRARTVGVSKYNNLNRALVGLYDLVGVAWLRKRTSTPATRELTQDNSRTS